MVVFGLVGIAFGILGLKFRDRYAEMHMRLYFNLGVDDPRRGAWRRWLVRLVAVSCWLIVALGLLLVAAGIATGNWVGS